jgi:hypothetical protein
MNIYKRLYGRNRELLAFDVRKVCRVGDDLPPGVSRCATSWFTDLLSDLAKAVGRIPLEELRNLLGVALAEPSILYLFGDCVYETFGQLARGITQSNVELRQKGLWEKR